MSDEIVEGYCQEFREANDDPMDGWGPIPTKLLKHHAQNWLSSRFQEFSSCWSLLRCHETDLIEVDKMKKVPMTFIFGDADE